jgi:hypothetical protein
MRYHQGREVLQSLVSSRDGEFGEFAQRQLVDVVVQVSHRGSEVLLIEDECHQVLDWLSECRLGRRQPLFTLLELDRTSILLILRIVPVSPLKESIFTRLRFVAAIGPVQTAFVLELGIEILHSFGKTTATKYLTLSTISNSAPPSPSLIIAAIV